MIDFLCSKCGKSLKVKDELAGRKGRCPHCQQPMTVPSLAEAARGRAVQAGQEEQAESETKTVRPTGSREAKRYDFLSAPQTEDEIGRLGTYRVLKVLNAGDRDVVFLAEDPKRKRPVLLKALLPGQAANGSNKEQFLRDARAAAAIEHDHLIAILEVNEDRGVPFVAMPLPRGESLENRLKRERKLPLDEAVRIVKETAEGLAEAHEHGMIHGNLRPANIWLEGETRQVKILDLGLTRPERDEASLSRPGADPGTVAYLAPEQCAADAVDTRCDLFSLGVVFYRMITGTLPFKGADAASTREAIATEMPTAPRKLNADLSPRMSRLIMELMAKDPDDRAPSALSVVDLLDELEHETPQEISGIVSERRAAPSLRAADDFDRDTFDDADLEEEPKKRSPMVPLLIGGGVGCFGLLVIAVIGGILLFRKSDTPQVAQSTNPPVENNPIQPPPINQNPNPPPNQNPNPPPNRVDRPKPDDKNKAGNPNVGGNDGGIKEPPKNNGAERPVEPPPQKAALRDADKQFKLHSSPVKGLRFAPDGKHAFSFAERTTKVDYWDTDTGEIVRSFELGGNPLNASIKHFSISKDGARLLAFNSSHLLCWEVESGKPLGSVEAPPGTTVCGGGFTADKDFRAALCAKLPGGSFVAFYDRLRDNYVPLLDPKTSKPKINKKTKKFEPLPFPHPGTEVELVLFGPDSKRFVSWSQDHMLRTWDIEQVRLLGTSPAAPGDLKAVAVSPDFTHLMGAFHQPEFRIYDVESGKEVKQIKPEGLGNSSTDALAYGGDSTIGVATRFGGNTCVYDVEEGTLKKEVKGIAFTTALALSADGKTILCGDIHGTIYVFKLVE